MISPSLSLDYVEHVQFPSNAYLTHEDKTTTKLGRMLISIRRSSNVFDQHVVVVVVPVLSVRLNSLVGGSRAATKSLDQRSGRMR